MPTIFSHHTHTTDSNHAERTVRNHTNEIHQADYVSMVGAAPPNLDLIFTRTEHWEADPTRFDRLAERVSERDGTVSTFESHVVFSVAGSRGAVINGIETSLETDTSHVTVCGLPIDRRPPARVCSLNVLCDLGREAAWVAPAHPRFPKLGFSDARLRRFLDRVGDEPFGVGLGYTTGYPAALNALARGLHTSHPITDYAREYDLPLLPELDWHTALPRTPSGLGVVDDEAFTALVDGRIPTTELLAARLLETGRWPGGVTWSDFSQTFLGGVLPSLRPYLGVAAPDEDRLRAIRDRTVGELFAHPYWMESAST